MTIQTFDKVSSTAFQKEASAALKALAAKHGVELTKNTGRYTGEQFVIKVEFKAQTVVGTAAVSTALVKACKLNSIAVSQKFKDSRGVTHTLADYNSRAWKTPFITKASDGKRYRWSAEAIIRNQKVNGI